MLFWKKEVIMEKYFQNTRGNDQKLPERISPTNHLGEILPSLDDWFKDLSSKNRHFEDPCLCIFRKFHVCFSSFPKEKLRRLLWKYLLFSGK